MLKKHWLKALHQNYHQESLSTSLKMEYFLEYTFRLINCIQSFTIFKHGYAKVFNYLDLISIFFFLNSITGELVSTYTVVICVQYAYICRYKVSKSNATLISSHLFFNPFAPPSSPTSFFTSCHSTKLTSSTYFMSPFFTHSLQSQNKNLSWTPNLI